MAELMERLLDLVKPDDFNGRAHAQGRDKLAPSEYADDKEAFASALAKSVEDGYAGKFEKSLDGAFVAQVPALGYASSLAKDISTTSPLSAAISQNMGLVPFDLQAPAKLLYPVYAPLRQRTPREQGQGAAEILKRILGIPGSGTGQAFVSPFVPEIPNAQSMSANWPLNDINAITLGADQLVIPYKIMHLDQSVSFEAQFQGRGFQDIAGLATLTLMQAMMLADEYSLISARSTAYATPGTPTLTARSANTGETAIGAGTVAVAYTVNNLFGETVTGGTALGTVTAGQVLDVTLNDVTGAEFYKVYANLNGSTLHYAGKTGWKKYTLQGPLPTTGTSPAADTGTGNTLNFNGYVSVLSGSANSLYDPNSAGLYSGYTTRHNGGTSGTAAFGYADVQTAFGSLYDNNKAQPQEIWAAASDRKALSEAILSAGADTQSYRIMLDPNSAGNVKVGAIVSSVYNESAGGAVELNAHPWLPQGNMLLLSHTLPFPQSEVTNLWAMRMVQDMLGISWPVIDARYRYSVYQYGAFVGYGPQFSGIIQGIPKSATAPYF